MQPITQTYEQQTFPFGEIESTSCREDSPASRSVRRGKGKARKTTVTSGPKCCELFDLLDPAGSWAKTFTELLVGREDWFSNRCVLTWKRKVTKFSRIYFQLAASALPTEDTEFGSSLSLWKTPVTADAADRAFYINSRGEPQLPAQAKLGFPATGKNWQSRILPTVQTQGLKMCENGKTKFYPARLLPTPKASPDGIYADKNPNSRRNSKSIATLAYEAGGRTFQLNPRFVADMMGFPADWTELPFLSGDGKVSKPTETR